MEKKEKLEKSKFYFLIGLLCIFGGFYIENQDAGKILLEVLGFVSILMGLMAYKKQNVAFLLMEAIVLLLGLVVADYGVAKTFHKIPVFVVQETQANGTRYRGLFYQASVCNKEIETIEFGSSNSKFSCPVSKEQQLQAELDALKKEQEKEETEKNPCSLIQTFTLTKKLGVTDETGSKEYAFFTRYQKEPVLVLLKKSDLNGMEEGKTYQLTFLGTHQKGEVSDSELLHDFSINIVTETNQIGVEAVNQTYCE